jgi:flagellar protein FlaJ
MRLVNFLPLAVAIVVTLPLVLSSVHEGVNRWTKRTALTLFGTYAQRIARNRDRRENALNAAHMPVTYRAYAAKTLLYGALAALAGTVFGVYGLSGLLLTQRLVTQQQAEDVLPETLAVLAGLFNVVELSLPELFALLLLSSGTIGVGLGLATYAARWWWPGHVASNRGRRIEASLPRTISFVYALSRSGMTFPKVMRILAENRAVYGDSADEFGVAVREMDVLGKDLLSSVKTMSARSPSEQFREFSGNLASVLQSGRNLSNFLREQYERYREEAEAQQEQLLELMATLAEVYVTMLVAGPLFLITILVIMGLFFGGTLRLLQLITYLTIPLLNFTFVLYLDAVTESMRVTRDRIDIEDPLGGIANVRRVSEREMGGVANVRGIEDADVDLNVQMLGDSESGNSSGPVPDGGAGGYTHPNVERLQRYNELRGIRRRLTQPVRTLLTDPTAILWVTVPVTVVWTALRLPGTVGPAGAVDVRVLDDILIQALLFVTGTFAVVHYAHERRVSRIEAVIPDFLDRLASINEAGMTIVESIGQVRRSDLGALDRELDRVWADIEWGADVESALYRFERRVQTTVVTRMVTLLNNAMSTSGELADVIRIAAEQAKTDRRLQRQRSQEMVTYLMVVYVSFLVFLVIIAAMNVWLIPSVEAAGTGQFTEDTGILGGLGNTDPSAYRLVFFHTAIVQGVCSGFVAGQMGGGDAKHGAKHAAAMLLVAYVAFLVMP